MKSPRKPSVSCGDYSLKQHDTVEYNISDESVARRVLKKINAKLNFLWRQSNYLNYSSRRLLCNALMQLHFDFGCRSWYLLLSKALKTKLQIAQNKCIRFCLELPSRGHINPNHFWKINCLPV